VFTLLEQTANAFVEEGEMPRFHDSEGALMASHGFRNPGGDRNSGFTFGRLTVVVLAMSLFRMPPGLAQTGQADAKLEFEVASVKPAAPFTGRQLPRGGPGSSDPAHVRYTYVSLKNLLILAYGMPTQQITGPAWIDSERYDIVANVPGGATADQLNVMLRNLLADRFKLVVHRETRELQRYELTVAKNGPRIKPYVEDPNEPIHEPGKPVFDKNGAPVLRPGGVGFATGPGERQLLGRKRSIEQLALILANELERPVVDKTGLTGNYDYTLKYAPNLTSAQTVPACWRRSRNSSG
jgi:uncharacterized protein (TIGR03435 family)